MFIKLAVILMIFLPVAAFVAKKVWTLWHAGNREEEEAGYFKRVERAKQLEQDAETLNQIDPKRVKKNLTEIKKITDLKM